jgi:acetate---CoA ligase (ADP-forming)
MLVETMLPAGLELVVGAHRERGWGPVVTVGLGGVWIETLHDIEILPATADRSEIVDGLLKLKAAALLQGYRGRPAANLDAIADCVMRLGALVRDEPRITEIEINPLLVSEKAAIALDVLMHIENA